MRVFVALGSLIGLAVLWGSVSAVPIWRYRLTFDVKTPEGPRSGSSVIQVAVDMNRRRFRVSGEAVAVDLGQRGTFFAILRSERNVDNASAIVWTAFPGPPSGTPGGIRYFSSLRAEADVPASAMPMLVSFRAMEDPTTVARVEAADLAASFGPGVTLRRARIRMVPAGIFPFNRLGFPAFENWVGTPISRLLRKKLPWLSRYPEPRILPLSNHYDYDPMSNLTHGDFIKE